MTASSAVRHVTLSPSMLATGSMALLLAQVVLGCLSTRASVAETTSVHGGTTVTTSYLRVYPPVGRWTLLQRGGNVCAVQISRTWSTADGHQWTEARFDWCNLTGTKDLCVSGVREGVATFGIETVAPRLPITSGENAIGCPGLMVEWFPPTGIGFARAGGPSESDDIEKFGVHIAATGWCDVRRANLKDARVKWLRFGDTAKAQSIELGPCW